MPPIIEVQKLFKVAVDNGNRVIEIDIGMHDVDDRIADIAVNHLQVATLMTPADGADGADVKQPELVQPKPKRGKGAKDVAVSNEGTSQT